jgi:prolyl-tRNA editing enzyme YbaK/EbsC (Cys-tRNA(Pro) deacylase)
MTEFSQKIKDWLRKENVDAEWLSFEESVHSVEQAVAVSGYPVERIAKSIVMLTPAGKLVIAMVPAKFRASTERVRKFLGLDLRPRIATADEIEHHTGQQVGGNSPFNAANATILIDPGLLDQDWILTGGGDDRHLVKIAIEELRRVVIFSEARVRR